MSSHQRLLSSTSRRALSRYASTSYFSNSAAGSSHSFSSVGAAQHHLVFKNNNINNINNKKHVFSTTTGSHDDFAAKSHVDASNAHEEIASDVAKETVVIYMKGSPNAPQCGFSNVACRILDHYGIPYASRNVLASDALRNGIKSFSNWPTIPQVFVGGEFLGGSDILMTMHQDGSLKKEFERVGLTVKTTEGSD
jgi:monothiol glutaredoxin